MAKKMKQSQDDFEDLGETTVAVEDAPVEDAPAEGKPEEAAPEKEDAPLQRYQVFLRHTVSPIKKFECLAKSEAEAWQKYLAAVRHKLEKTDSKDDRKQLRDFLATTDGCQKIIQRMDA